MPDKIVYIASLSHSGSTLLDLVLGGHENLTGLGEIALTVSSDPSEVSRVHQATCSCGRAVDGCPFWSTVMKSLAKIEDTDLVSRYQAVLNAFEAVFGADQVLVDSSKYLPALQSVYGECGDELRVIHLIKDVRNYTISQLSKRKDKGVRHHYRAWYKQNREIISYLQRNRITHMTLGYEELCLQPELVLPKVCEFLGIDWQARMLDIKNSTSHVMRGNRMRIQAEKRQSIQYDHRWFYRTEWYLPALFHPRIMQFNSAKVYANQYDSAWSR